jgi:hypothetical protein
MWDSRLAASLVVLALLTMAAGCGGDEDDDAGASPASLRSQLLPESELPGFATEGTTEWGNPIDFAHRGLLIPESTPLSQAVGALEGANFEAALGERFAEAGGNPFEGAHASVAVAQLGSDGDAREVLDYARQEALKPPCLGDCSVNGREFAVPGIPGAKGVQLTPDPDPPPDAPPPFVSYAAMFTIGPRFYLVDADGEPGQVEKDQVLSAARALHEQNAR